MISFKENQHTQVGVRGRVGKERERKGGEREDRRKPAKEG